MHQPHLSDTMYENIWKIRTLLLPYFSHERWHMGTFSHHKLPVARQHDFSFLGYDADNIPSLFIWWSVQEFSQVIIEQYIADIRTLPPKLSEEYANVENIYGCLVRKFWPAELKKRNWPFLRLIDASDIDVPLYEHFLTLLA